MPRIHKDDPGLVYARKTQDAGTIREGGASVRSGAYEDKKGKQEFLHENYSRSGMSVTLLEEPTTLIVGPPDPTRAK